MEAYMNFLGTVLVLLFSFQAFSLEVRTCEEANVGIADLLDPTEKRNYRVFLKGDLTLYVVDQVEPTCCSIGLVVVSYEPETDVPTCKVVMGLNNIDLRYASVTPINKDSDTYKIDVNVNMYDAENGGSLPTQSLLLDFDSSLNTLTNPILAN